MVIPLKPGRFYGKSLPRPHIYSDVKFNTQRVDPPPSVNDALIRWAGDAHWSMGGLSFTTTRTRTHGKIEGRIHKIRSEEDHQSPPKDCVKSPRKMKKGLVFDSQTTVLTKSVSPIDALFLAEAKDRDSGRRFSPISRSLPLSTVKGRSEKMPVKRALLVEDSDGGLEEFVKDSGRPLRRSGRLQIAASVPDAE